MNALVMHPVTKANLTLGSGDASTFTVTDDGGGVTVVRAAAATTALAAADAAQLVLASEALGNVPDHGSLPGLLDDDHPQYHTDARGDARYDALGTTAAGMAAHLAAVDPHPQYLTPAEGSAAYEVLGTMALHIAMGDPHPQYLTAAEGTAAYSLLGHTHVAANITDFTSAADARVAAGNALTATAWQTGRTITLTGMVTGVSGAFNGTSNLSFAASLGSFTKAQLDAAVSDGDVSYVGHTHVLAAGATDVSITAANLNALDDGADTALHFHASDRDRANHTGSQLANTISDFSEAVDDRVAALLVAGTNITLTYNDGANTLTIDASSGGGSGLSDGDYGDISVSGSGTVISIDAGVVDTAELADGGVTTAKIADDAVTLAKLATEVMQSYNASLGADVQLSTANTFFDGPSLASLPAGTYLVMAHAQFQKTATTASQVTARITDGTNHYASQNIYHASLNGITLGFSMSTIVTLASVATLKIQMASTVGNANNLMKAASPNNGSGNIATQITAIRIA